MKFKVCAIILGETEFFSIPFSHRSLDLEGSLRETAITQIEGELEGGIENTHLSCAGSHGETLFGEVRAEGMRFLVEVESTGWIP